MRKILTIMWSIFIKLWNFFLRKENVVVLVKKQVFEPQTEIDVTVELGYNELSGTTKICSL
jgi:hypothetical protein